MEIEKKYTGRCYDCKNGEHENYTDDVELVIVKDPSGKMIKRVNLCSEHIIVYLDDGYLVY